MNKPRVLFGVVPSPNVPIRWRLKHGFGWGYGMASSYGAGEGYGFQYGGANITGAGLGREET